MARVDIAGHKVGAGQACFISYQMRQGHPTNGWSMSAYPSVPI